MAAEGERQMLWRLVLLALGIALYSALPLEPSAGFIVLAAVLVMALIALGRFWAGRDVWAFGLAP